MNKLNFPYPSYDVAADSLTLPGVPVNTSLELARRLIILVPPDCDYNSVIHRVWKLAKASESHVQLLGLCKEEAQEPSLRRGLVTMASLLQDGNVSAELNVEFGANWVEAVKRNSREGDMIVCFAEQRAGLLQRPLSQILQSNLKNPIYILSSLSLPNPPRSHWLSQMKGWLGSLAIIVIAFLFQIQITSLPQDWIQTTLLILSVIAETWLIGVWNSLFG